MKSLLALIVLAAAFAVGACTSPGASGTPAVDPISSPSTAPMMSPEMSPEESAEASPS